MLSLLTTRKVWRNRLLAGLVSLMVASLLLVQAGSVTKVAKADTSPLQYTGVNLAGAEFAFNPFNNYIGKGAYPGTYGNGQDYFYPTHADVDYFYSKGMNVFRIPIRWERIQPALDGSLDGTETSRLLDIVSYITGKGATAIVDVHNYGRYVFSDNSAAVIGEPGSAVTSENFGNLWANLTGNFAHNSNVIFDLMNEPFDNDFGSNPSGAMDTQVWVNDANTAIQAIRNTESANGGVTHLILVEGMQFSNANNWFSQKFNYGNHVDPLDPSHTKPNSVYLLNISDPANNYVYEIHQYIDKTEDGNTQPNQCVVDPLANIDRITQWLNDNGKRGWLGEFNVGDDDGNGNSCEGILDTWLNHLEQNSNVWLGWTYWAAGTAWGNAETLQPTVDGGGNYVDRPQMTWLINGNHLHGN